ncbi:hypothetical protein [Natranaeroarchaeum sulfidigenes]|uniref:Uncharacterized protein n=1 Tax=Natranaeroarchaeum sulfidigenes TaxID=2784880 RepID=A0A897MU94_9EURY|nr:hypothetical protein [Natranaeroarchaeum sulfidigenes]QSG01766.1 Uncharacterized protein AArcS_0538 [Natranaeroarchaeum sulfidigenes]
MDRTESAIISEGEFQAALASLLRKADANDVEVEGGWDCRNGDEHPDWDVMVTEVKKNADAE